MGADSKTPLYKKLGIKEGFSNYVKNAPCSYPQLFDGLPNHISFKNRISNNLDFINLFVRTKSQLQRFYLTLFKALKIDGIFWTSWPKGGSKLRTNLNRDYIREYVLENGLVDVKVCSINKNWSALKFVYRLKDRK